MKARGKDLALPAKGQGLLEFALIIPIVLITILGLVQFGIGVYAQITVTSAAQSGAHLASEQGQGLADGETKARTIINNSFGRDVAANAQIEASLVDVQGGDGQNVQISVKVSLPTFVPFLENALRFTFSSKAVVFKEQWLTD